MIHCLCGGIPIKLIAVISSHIDAGTGAAEGPAPGPRGLPLALAGVANIALARILP